MGGTDTDGTLHVQSADPPIPVRIAPLAPAHAADAARLHISGQTNTFLAELGPGILEIVYEKLPRTDVGFGFVAVSPACREARPVVVGFVSAATSVGSLFVQTAATRAGRLLPALTSRCLRRPALIGRTVQTALYPFLDTTRNRRDEDAGPRAELLSIMVEPHWRSRGVGAMLLHALLDECGARRIAHVDVTVDAANSDAQRFYARHGFHEQSTFTLYGREMRQYGRRV